MKAVSFLFLLFFFFTVSAQAGGGMDSGGGTDGLFYRIKAARELALEVLILVNAESFARSSPELRAFYRRHRLDLIEEAKTTEVSVKPSEDVFIQQKGRKQFKTMVTGLTRGSAIFVSNQMSVVDPLEVAAFLLHEYGHHMGIAQEEDEFLDRFANALVGHARDLSLYFRAKTATCLSEQQIYLALEGKWVGESHTPWRPVLPIEMTFSGDGHYSDRSLPKDESYINTIPLYYGVEGDYASKKIEVEQYCGDRGRGLIYIGFDQKFSRPIELRVLKISSDRKELSFQFQFPNAVSPVKIQLRRRSNPD